MTQNLPNDGIEEFLLTPSTSQFADGYNFFKFLIVVLSVFLFWSFFNHALKLNLQGRGAWQDDLVEELRREWNAYTLIVGFLVAFILLVLIPWYQEGMPFREAMVALVIWMVSVWWRMRE
jgi:hypothetical protein